MLQVEVLVQQCKTNNRRAQMELYKLYCNGMLTVAMRFLENQDDAEDAVQEAFIKAFQKIEQFKGEVTFGAWLKRIVVNKSIDFIKSKRLISVTLDESYMHVEDENEGDWSVANEIQIEEVKHAITALPENYRFVVQLYLLEGYDHKEISKILSISETASRTRLLRGKSQLKELLKSKSYGARS